MGWTFDLDGLTVEEDGEWTAGQWETLYVLANRVIAHREVDIDPLHCPSCRIAIAAYAFTAELPVDGAIERAINISAGELVDAFTPEDPPVEE